MHIVRIALALIQEFMVSRYINTLMLCFMLDLFLSNAQVSFPYKVKSLIKHENRSKIGKRATSNAQATTRGLCVS